jgi:hypothetical protein
VTKLDEKLIVAGGNGSVIHLDEDVFDRIPNVSPVQLVVEVRVDKARRAHQCGLRAICAGDEAVPSAAFAKSLLVWVGTAGKQCIFDLGEEGEEAIQDLSGLVMAVSDGVV